MDSVFAKVAELDVHHKFITVGIRCRLETGKLFAEVRTFATMTSWSGTLKKSAVGSLNASSRCSTVIGSSD